MLGKSNTTITEYGVSHATGGGIRCKLFHRAQPIGCWEAEWLQRRIDSSAGKTLGEPEFACKPGCRCSRYDDRKLEVYKELFSDY